MGPAEAITLSNFELTRFFFAIVLLLAAAHGFGHLFQYFKLPRVIGEITGGIFLGPSILGHYLPDVYNWIFNAFEAEGKLISIIYWFGLIFLMFISGFEMKTSYTKSDRKTIFALLIGATAIPLVAGWIAPMVYDFRPLLGPAENMTALRIVIAIAVAVTSIPVISRIFIDLKVMETRFARIVLATATIQDVLLWAALAIATGVVSAKEVSFSGIMTTVSITVAFFGVALFVMPRLIQWANTLRYNILMKSSKSAYALLICFLFGALASVLDVNIVFGAFLAGIVFGRIPDKRFDPARAHIKEMALSFFVPIYFAVVGLKIDLIQHFDIGFFLIFLLFTTAFEGIGTITAAKLIGRSWLSCVNLGVAMNTRGGPGIVLATVAFDMGIINQTFFVTLVLIAIITSLMAGFWFRLVLSQGWQLLAEDEE